jgi:pyrimidine-nucleoside phosphorylase
LDFRTIIAKRRSGEAHEERELRMLAQGAADGSIPDYQLAAWLMAAVLRPLTTQETAWLTVAMAESGQRLDLTGLPQPCLDKHSTGGVGDKTTIVLLPLLAACGVTVVKMSGRGLGITGGTVDKLESVPGFRMDLSPAELLAQASRFGLAITGPTAELAPADRALYALRDATGTVASVPLIVSSILSKKLAGGAKNLVLDVKCGSGGFMPTFDAARELAQALRQTGELCGLKVRVALTDMTQPLGRAVGNALEVEEAFEVLSGEAGGRQRQAAQLQAEGGKPAAGRAASPSDGVEIAREAIARGHALHKAEEWFVAQGASGSRGSWGLPRARLQTEIPLAGEGGWIARLDPRAVGEAAVLLGAGRKTKTDAVLPAAGIECLAEVGDEVRPGHKLFRIHAETEEAAQAAQERLAEAVGVHSERVPPPPLILETF